MNIKDFIVEDDLFEPNFNFVEVGYFDEIDYDKKELLRSVASFISKKTYENIFDLYNNFKIPPYDYSYIQCLAKNGRTKLLVPITLIENINDKETRIVTEEKFRADVSKYTLVGSQNYSSINLRGAQSEVGYKNIFFTDDDNAFIHPDLRYYMSNVNIYTLANDLVKAVKIEEKESKQRKKHYSLLLKKNNKNK